MVYKSWLERTSVREDNSQKGGICAENKGGFNTGSGCLDLLGAQTFSVGGSQPEILPLASALEYRSLRTCGVCRNLSRLVYRFTPTLFLLPVHS